MLKSGTIKFLKDLKKNNNKPWFDAHRIAYEDAKLDFGIFVQTIIEKHGKKDASIASLKAKDCIFRINRDIRFSKDKTPYKSHFGASINRGGKKSVFSGYYFQCDPSNCFVGGGLWSPMPEDLKKVRQEIDYCFDEFKKIIASKKFKAVYGDLRISEELSLQKVPAGFEKDNPAAVYLKLKSFIAMRTLDIKDLTSKELIKKTTEALDALQPMIEFINRALA